MQRTVMALCLSIALFGALPCIAAEVPEWDTKATCKKQAALAGGNKMLELQCRKLEYATYTILKSAKLPDEAIKNCAQQLEMMESTSYAILEQCIKNEIAASALLN